MNPREAGFLLLSSHLGDPERRPLSAAQMQLLAERAIRLPPADADRELTERDLLQLGLGRELAQRIGRLLDGEALLQHYLSRGKKAGCCPVTRVSAGYPRLLRRRLGTQSPGCLWTKGDVELLTQPAIALVGSRDLAEKNRVFAEAAGQFAAERGLVLVSGNARGADRAAQEACLRSGGRVISIVADELAGKPVREGVLYVSEEEFDAPFSASRAHSRNRVIHAMGQMVLVAQAARGKGGTWAGTVKNLQEGWSPVACFRDGSDASRELEQLGAYLIGTDALPGLSLLGQQEVSFWDTV